MRFIFLIGPPGAGKTACGQALARLLDCPFEDTDRLIERDCRMSVSDVFATSGEVHFRQQETALLESLPDRLSGDGWCVLATGGGMPVYNDNLKRLAQLGTVVALQAPLPVLVDRLKGSKHRPLLASAGEADDNLLSQRLSQLLAERDAVYDKAGYKIDTAGLKPEQVAEKIIRDLSLL